jgi:hypothetical protein
VRVAGEQRRGRHDHSRLAVSALRDLVRDPRGLQRMRLLFRRQTFDRRDLLAWHGRCRDGARAHGGAIDVDGAGTAGSNAAAELGPGQAERFPQHPKQGRVFVHIGGARLAVDVQSDLHRNPPLVLVVAGLCAFAESG